MAWSVASGGVLWVLGGAVSAANALTPRVRANPPDVGWELFSEVDPWSSPAWVVASAAFAAVLFFGSRPGLRVTRMPGVVAVMALTAYGLTGGVAEALLPGGMAGGGRSLLDDVAGAVFTSLVMGYNGVFAVLVGVLGLWAISRTVGGRPSHPADRGRGDQVSGGSAGREPGKFGISETLSLGEGRSRSPAS